MILLLLLVLQILSSLEQLMNNLPRLIRSISEPTLHRNYLQHAHDEYDYLYACQSPRTPININGQLGAFPFFTSSTQGGAGGGGVNY